MNAANNPFAYLVPALGSLISGYTQGQSAKEAAEVTAGAANRAADLQRQTAQDVLALQKQMYQEGVARQQPYYQAGVNALAEMQGRTNAMPEAFKYEGQQPAAFSFSADNFQADPGYAFRLSEGLKAIERGAAARGGLLSGGTGKALTRFGQDLASQEYQNAYNRALTGYDIGRQREQEQYGRALTGYNAQTSREAQQYNRLAGLAGIGGTTAQQLTATGQNYGTSAGNVMSNTANNLANIAVNQGNTAGNALLAQGAAYGRAFGDLGYLGGQYLGYPRP